jgi:ATP-dependent RNA helicase RhlE
MLDGFRSGRYKILVATDVAARGIDVRGVSHVINYDIPESANSYTHRIGRTGRACETGDAFTFVTSKDKGPAFSITRVLGNKLKHCVMEDFDSTPPVRERKSVHKHNRAPYENKNRLAKSKPRKRPKSKYPPETGSRRNTFVN